jgi:hypothetical protein
MTTRPAMSPPSRHGSAADWLRPYYAELALRTGFANLSTAHQLRALVERVSPDHPVKAAELRDSNAAAARALLDWLAKATGQKPTARKVALWRVCKGQRELRCVAVYLSTGIDLRLMEGDDFRRTRLCSDRATLTAGAEDWLRKLAQHGWVKIEAGATSADR